MASPGNQHAGRRGARLKRHPPKYWLDIAAQKASRNIRNRLHPHPSDEMLTVGEVGALSDFDNITVRIANVAANLAVLGDRFRDEFGSSTLP